MYVESSITNSSHNSLLTSFIANWFSLLRIRSTEHLTLYSYGNIWYRMFMHFFYHCRRRIILSSSWILIFTVYCYIEVMYGTVKPRYTVHRTIATGNRKQMTDQCVRMKFGVNETDNNRTAVYFSYYYYTIVRRSLSLRSQHSRRPLWALHVGLLRLTDRWYARRLSAVPLPSRQQLRSAPRRSSRLSGLSLWTHRSDHSLSDITMSRCSYV